MNRKHNQIFSIILAICLFLSTLPIGKVEAQPIDNKNLNFQIVTDYSGQALMDLQGKLNGFKSEMFENGINANVNLNNGVISNNPIKNVDFDKNIITTNDKTEYDMTIGKESNSQYAYQSIIAGVNSTEKILKTEEDFVLTDKSLYKATSYSYNSSTQTYKATSYIDMSVELKNRFPSFTNTTKILNFYTNQIRYSQYDNVYFQVIICDNNKKYIRIYENDSGSTSTNYYEKELPQGQISFSNVENPYFNIDNDVYMYDKSWFTDQSSDQLRKVNNVYGKFINSITNKEIESGYAYFTIIQTDQGMFINSYQNWARDTATELPLIHLNSGIFHKAENIKGNLLNAIPLWHNIGNMNLISLTGYVIYTTDGLYMYGNFYGYSFIDTEQKINDFNGETIRKVVIQQSNIYVLTNQKLYGAGNNSDGQLGMGNYLTVQKFTSIPLNSHIDDFYADASLDYTGESFSPPAPIRNRLYVVSGGNIYSSGNNAWGTLGANTSIGKLNILTQITGIQENIIDITVVNDMAYISTSAGIFKVGKTRKLSQGWEPTNIYAPLTKSIDKKIYKVYKNKKLDSWWDGKLVFLTDTGIYGTGAGIYKTLNYNFSGYWQQVDNIIKITSNITSNDVLNCSEYTSFENFNNTDINVYITASEGTSYIPPAFTDTLYSKISSSEFYTVSDNDIRDKVISPIQQYSINQFVNKFGEKGKSFEDIDIFLQYLKDKYLSKQLIDTHPPFIILKNSILKFDKYYRDYEGDPGIAEKFKFEVDNTLYKNEKENINENGVWSKNYTQGEFLNEVKLDVKGLWKITYKVQDGPPPINVGNSEEYNSYLEKIGKVSKWSKDSHDLYLIVNERPIADAEVIVDSLGNISYSDRSYDPDKIDLIAGIPQLKSSIDGNGIVEEVWKWKCLDEETPIWHYGKLANIDMTKKYVVQLQVKDFEGYLSNIWIKELQLEDNIIKENIPPTPYFEPSKVAAFYNENIILNDYSLPNDENDYIVEWKFEYTTDVNKAENEAVWIPLNDKMTKVNNSYTFNTNIVKSTWNDATEIPQMFKIRLNVKDFGVGPELNQLGKWSEKSYIKNFKIYPKNIAPTALFKTYKEEEYKNIDITNNAIKEVVENSKITLKDSSLCNNNVAWDNIEDYNFKIRHKASSSYTAWEELLNYEEINLDYRGFISELTPYDEYQIIENVKDRGNDISSELMDDSDVTTIRIFDKNTKPTADFEIQDTNGVKTNAISIGATFKLKDLSNANDKWDSIKSKIYGYYKVGDINNKVTISNINSISINTEGTYVIYQQVTDTGSHLTLEGCTSLTDATKDEEKYRITVIPNSKVVADFIIKPGIDVHGNPAIEDNKPCVLENSTLEIEDKSYVTKPLYDKITNQEWRYKIGTFSSYGLPLPKSMLYMPNGEVELKRNVGIAYAEGSVNLFAESEKDNKLTTGGSTKEQAIRIYKVNTAPTLDFLIPSILFKGQNYELTYSSDPNDDWDSIDHSTLECQYSKYNDTTSAWSDWTSFSKDNFSSILNEKVNVKVRLRVADKGNILSKGLFSLWKEQEFEIKEEIPVLDFTVSPEKLFDEDLNYTEPWLMKKGVIDLQDTIISGSKKYSYSFDNGITWSVEQATAYLTPAAHKGIKSLDLLALPIGCKIKLKVDVNSIFGYTINNVEAIKDVMLYPRNSTPSATFDLDSYEILENQNINIKNIVQSTNDGSWDSIKSTNKYLVNHYDNSITSISTNAFTAEIKDNEEVANYDIYMKNYDTGNKLSGSLPNVELDMYGNDNYKATGTSYKSFKVYWINHKPSVTASLSASTVCVNAPVIINVNTNINDKHNDTAEEYEVNYTRYALDSLVPLENKLYSKSSTLSLPNKFATVGDYDIKIKVRDKGNKLSPAQWSDEITLKLKVLPQNTKPTASFTVTPNPQLVNTNLIYVDTSNANDGWDSIVTREWSYASVNNGVVGSWSTVNATAPTKFVTAGNYRIRLIVKDKGNVVSPGLWSDYCERDITILPVNTKPIANFSINPVTQFVNLDVNFADSSYDPDTWDSLIEWEWGYRLKNTGNYTVWCWSAANKPPALKFDTVGTYEIRLRVKDKGNILSPGIWSDYCTKEIVIKDIKIDGAVNHTDDWNQNRIKYNLSKSGATDSPRTYDTFFKGEKFILKANTEGDIDKVTVKIEGYSFSTNLVKISANTWEGSLWDESMLTWGDRDLKFIFTAYQGSYFKADAVNVKIKDDEYWRLHRDF